MNGRRTATALPKLLKPFKLFKLLYRFFTNGRRDATALPINYLKITALIGFKNLSISRRSSVITSAVPVISCVKSSCLW